MCSSDIEFAARVAGLNTVHTTGHRVTRIYVDPQITPAMKTGRMSAAAVGMLLCASAYTTPAAGASSADALPPGTPLYAYFREARSASVLAQRTADSDEIRRRTDDPTRIFFDGEAAQPAGLTAGSTARVRGRARALAAQYRPVAGSASELSAPIDASLSDLLARFHSAFGSDLGFSSDRARQGDREALVRNSDAFVRAKILLTLGEEWLGFVYADLGAVDSALRWQGLAGIRCGHGVDLLGGWRHVTYHFSPGSGFDSLDFNGPFLGATLTW
jgi:hypothetical protein